MFRVKKFWRIGWTSAIDGRANGLPRRQGDGKRRKGQYVRMLQKTVRYRMKMLANESDYIAR